MNNFEQPEQGEIKVIDGKKYRKVDSGYTIKEWYSHHTDGKGPGPGWDGRMALLDKDHALKKFGREFTEEEVFNPSKLPDTPYYEWKLIEEDK